MIDRTILTTVALLIGLYIDFSESWGQTSSRTTPDFTTAFISHRLQSEYQAGETSVRVLLPDNIDSQKRYPVLYVLPVIANDERKYGDGLLEVKQRDFHNKHQLVCVAPEFTAKPWFADHDGNPTMRDESHLLKVVIPYIDKNYPTQSESKGRLLIGFSKSGWGAISLLLRNPDLFYRAAGSDTGIRLDTGPIEEEERAKRIANIWGSKENFEKYRLSNLFRQAGRRTR